MIDHHKTRMSHLNLLISAFLLFIIIPSSKANAALVLQLSDLSNGYSSCSWTDNGDGTSTILASVSFKTASGHTGKYAFISRGLLLYTYDKNGKLNPNNARAKSVKLNDREHWSIQDGPNYLMYYNSQYDEWKNSEPYTANFEILINNAIVADWPAFGVRAGIFTNRDDVGDSMGAAYISRYGNDPTGTCKVIEPTTPPPPIVAINVTAPDWSLGELQLGNNTKVFANSADQLCFTYSGAAVSGKNYIINASNANGVVNGSYLLKHLTDTSKTVPYSVKLDSGTSTVSLPNVSNTAVPLSSSGKTCFVPTFTTTVDKLTKAGDYNDVLTFMVVTKS